MYLFITFDIFISIIYFYFQEILSEFFSVLGDTTIDGTSIKDFYCITYTKKLYR